VLQRTFLTGLAVALLAAQACGSDDGKKKAISDADAGMGGQAGSPEEPSAGGSSAGAPVSTAGEAPTEAGAGGTGVVVEGGTGGTGEVVGGAAGQPTQPILPDPELLFTIKNSQGGSPGLPGTAVNQQQHPENTIYTSSTGSQDRVNGTNAVRVTGAQLGLNDTDQIVAFAEVLPEPANPMYLFSIADGSEGANQTRTYASYWQEGNDEQGQLYYSEGTQSTRYIGEGGDEYGYNAILATDASIGLNPSLQNGPPADDLGGVAVHDKHLPLTELYFTVSAFSGGLAGSAVADVPAGERACTVFKSALDGTNSVAYSCADLGLVVDDQIDGLAVQGDASVASQVVFSVSVNSQGAVDSGVSTTVAANARVGAVLFTSAGDGANAVLKSARDLGLGEYVDDEIDGFTIVEAPAKPSVAHAATCSMSYDPRGAGGGKLVSISGVSHIGTNTMLLFGQTAGQVARVIAYNATTCAFLQQQDLPAGFDIPTALAVVPLAGWAAAKPLDKVEYLRITDDGQATYKAVSRYDAAGTFVALFPIANTIYSDTPEALVYEPLGDRLYVVMDSNNGYPKKLAVVPRPAATDTTLDATFRDITMPCSNEVEVNGTDGAGNLLLAKVQATGTDYKVCAFRPNGELFPLPYSWSSDAMNDARGFIVAGGSHFLLRSGATTVMIERGAYQAP
jgi:hypothetical protein